VAKHAFKISGAHQHIKSDIPNRNRTLDELLLRSDCLIQVSVFHAVLRSRVAAAVA